MKLRQELVSLSGIIGLVLLFVFFIASCGTEKDENLSIMEGGGNGAGDSNANDSDQGGTAYSGTADGGGTAASKSSGSAGGAPMAESDENIQSMPDSVDEKEDKKYFYFSYDDSSSTAGVQLTKYALNHGNFPQKSWARPYEFLNYEEFVKEGTEKKEIFDIAMGLWKRAIPGQTGEYSYEFGAMVASPAKKKEDRKNLVITLVVDVSGSMGQTSFKVTDEAQGEWSLMEIAKYGLEKMAGSLKEGDVVNLVEFHSQAATLLEDYHFTENDKNYQEAVAKLVPKGSTNLNAGIDLGYKLAQKYFNADKMNRVVILTDAYANRGVVDVKKISEKTQINDMEGIYFSGLGFGANFNDAFLNQLTDHGRGAYFSVITAHDAKRAFVDRFIALIDVAAKNVRFRLDFPEQLKHTKTAAEQVSTQKSEVQPTNFSYNTSQFFKESFDLLKKEGLDEAEFKLTVEYKEPAKDKDQTIEYKLKVKDMLDKQTDNIKDAHLITMLTSLIKGEMKSTESDDDIAENFKDFQTVNAKEYLDLITKWKKLSSQ